MSDALRVFVNGSAVDVAAGTDVAAAVAAADPSMAEKIAHGAAYVTDGRGIEIDPAARLAAGAILRVIVRARRGVTDADA
jgi:hypothetical protein